MEKPEYSRINQENIVLGGYSCGGTLTVPLAIHFTKKNLHFMSLMYISPIFDYSTAKTPWQSRRSSLSDGALSKERTITL